MPLSLYEATVPSFLQILTPLGALIEKAGAHCAAQGVSEESFCAASLAPDMWPFAKQVTAVCQHSAGAIAGAMAGEGGPDLAPAPLAFAALAQRVDSAVASLKAITPEQIAALGAQDYTFRIGDRRMDFTVRDYLLSFALPNFYFHASMAYAVLRHQGLAIGKRDFLGAVRTKA